MIALLALGCFYRTVEVLRLLQMIGRYLNYR